MYNAIAVILCFLLPLLIVRKTIKKEKTLKEFFHTNKYEILIYLIFVVGFITRLVGIVEYPAGLNQDEASAGYEAYSILNYGVDRHGKLFPVHFISWRDGQNVLYSYLMIPFIYLFGLSVLTVRLPMAIVGCISLMLVYKLLNRYNKKLGLIGLFFFAICPWHIMKCRWGLEANLFPDMVLIAVYIIIKALHSNKLINFYIGIAFLSLSVYSYGTSYAFLPIFIFILIIYLLKIKKINIYNALISFTIAGIIALPMILFVIINTFDYNEIHLLFITIPKLYNTRFEDMVTISSPNFFDTVLNNFVYNTNIILKQTDSTTYNGLPFYGICYVFSLPFTVLGLFKCLTKRNIEKNILNIWLIVSVILLIICHKTNINRLNIIMIPVIMYTILGIYDIIENNKNSIIPIITLYVISFLCFTNAYKKTLGESNSPFTQGVQEPIQYASSLDVEHVYISYSFTEPYIYTLFYTQTSSIEFVDTAEYLQGNPATGQVLAFGKYSFYIPSDMREKNVAYIVPSDYKYNTQYFKATDFGRYTVLETK